MEDLQEGAHGFGEEAARDNSGEEGIFKRDVGDAIVPDEEICWEIIVFGGEILRIVETFEDGLGEGAGFFP